MKNWILMKKKEIELKLLAYGYILDFVKDKDEIITALSALITELSHTSKEELVDKFVSSVAEIVHNQSQG